MSDQECPVPGASQHEPDGLSSAAQVRWRSFIRLATVDIGPLRRHREFQLLFAGQSISFLGGMITVVAIPYQLYQLTRSSLAVGLLGLADIIAILALAFLGGALADAHDRRRLVQRTELAMAAMSGCLVVNALLPRPQIWLLYAISTAITGLDSLQRPSLNALLPRLVDTSELTAAAALSSLRTTTGMIAGPALAGILIAVVGLASTYAVDVVSFAASLATLRMMRAVPPPPDAERASLRRVVEGLRYARSRPELVGTYLVDMVAMFFGMPSALFPALAANHGGPRALGFLYAAPAVGSFVATATSGWTGHIHRHGQAVVFAAAAWGVAIIFFGLAGSLPLALLFLGIAGAADTLSGLFRSTIWNQTIPDALRGRLASIELVSYSSGPTLGNLESGAVASLFGIRVSIVSGGALCVVGVVILGLALPAFRQYDGRSRITSVADR